jgi:hypothetical protein
MLMKRNMLVLMALSTACMQAMEDANSWSITIDKTKINVIKGFVGDAGDRVDMIVLGRRQQRRLQQPSFGDMSNVGEIDICEDHIIYRKSKDDESASDDETYKPIKIASSSKEDMEELIETQKRLQNAIKINVKSNVIDIVEPVIRRKTPLQCFEDRGWFTYYAEREDLGKCRDLGPCWLDQPVKRESGYTSIIEAASDDLKYCYQQALDAGLRLQEATDKKEISIAFAALGTDVGFPRDKAAPIAITTILEFIKNNFDAYNVIELFVKKNSEFVLYKELLQKYMAENKEYYMGIALGRQLILDILNNEK